MPKGDPGLFVDYCAKDFLDATQFMDPWEELAYRRICDLIYTSNNNLQNDDRMLAWATRTGRRWPQIKVALTSGEKPKLVIVDGKLTNKRCTDALATAARKIAQKTIAGRASSATGKSLKNLKPFRTDVVTSVENGVQNGDQNGAQNLPIEPIEDSRDSESPSENQSPTKNAAARRNGEYVFAGKIVRLRREHYDEWRKAFHGIADLDAALTTLDNFYDARLEGDERSNWYIRCSKALEKEHQKILSERTAPQRSFTLGIG